MLAPVRLGIFLAGSFDVLHVLGVISSVYASKLQGISPTLMLVSSAIFKQNGGNEITAPPVLRTREP